MKVAQSYFDKLVSMGLIQDIDVDNSDGVLYYAVHHLVHDFITSKSKEENFVNVIDYSQRTIRLANKVTCSDTVHLPDQMQGLKHLETLEINAGVAAVPSDLFHLQSLLHLRLGGGTELPDVTGILRNVTVPSAAILLDESSSPPNSVMAIELLPPICIIPEWFGQLNNLCILKVVVGELLRDDIHILGGLPALTVLTLFVQRQTTELISFAPGAFYALEYFEFRCGVLLLMFEEGAMPNLQRIKLEEYDLKAAESAFKDASGKHPSNVSIKRSESQEDIKQNAANNFQLIDRTTSKKGHASVELLTQKTIRFKIADITSKRWNPVPSKSFQSFRSTSPHSEPLELDSAKVAAVIAALRLRSLAGPIDPTVVQHRANTFNSDSSGDDDDEDPSDGYMCYPPISFLETGDAPLFLTGSTDSARPGDGLYRLSDVHDNPWILREGITTVAGPCELTNETTMTWVMRLKITTKLVCLIKQQLLEQNRELSEECFAKLTVFETLVDVLFNIQDLHFIRSGEDYCSLPE
ncbi:hypothetical protein ZWY2020_008482 [Hordeum vulgare]|nr:hypothetical protein ZWY2020_008482 [Hordeum vulgare]